MRNAEAAAGEDLAEIPPGSLRHTALLTAKRFKSIWVEFGALLVRVRDGLQYQQWGYSTFEEYCAKELRIRRQTALKLTRSYSFLAKHEPKSSIDQESGYRAPRFEVVEVLADAEQRGQLSESEYASVRDSIWNSNQSLSGLKRDLAERFPAPQQRAQSQGAPRRLAADARRLAKELAAHRRVPRAIVERASALADDVEEWSANSQER
jgi:hypothetical protein